MPNIIIPRSNEELIRFFETATRVATEDRLAEKFYTDADWITQASDFVEDFKTRVRNLTTAQRNRAQQIEERRVKVAKLEVYVRDYLNGFKRMVYREGLPISLFAFYDLPESGEIPLLSNTNEVISWAEKIVKGNADAVAATYPAMSNPTAAQVATVLAEANAEIDDVSAVERHLDVALDEIEAQRATGYALAQDAEQQLNFQLRKLTSPDRRRIMRTYGFAYTYAEGETPDPEDPPTN